MTFPAQFTALVSGCLAVDHHCYVDRSTETIYIGSEAQYRLDGTLISRDRSRCHFDSYTATGSFATFGSNPGGESQVIGVYNSARVELYRIDLRPLETDNNLLFFLSNDNYLIIYSSPVSSPIYIFDHQGRRLPNRDLGRHFSTGRSGSHLQFIGVNDRELVALFNDDVWWFDLATRTVTRRLPVLAGLGYRPFGRPNLERIILLPNGQLVVQDNDYSVRIYDRDSEIPTIISIPTTVSKVDVVDLSCDQNNHLHLVIIEDGKYFHEEPVEVKVRVLSLN